MAGSLALGHGGSIAFTSSSRALHKLEATDKTKEGDVEGETAEGDASLPARDGGRRRVGGCCDTNMVLQGGFASGGEEKGGFARDSKEAILTVCVCVCV